jgi:branched-chain amino acid transport system ATP-binding protein
MDEIFTLFREMNRTALTLFIVEQEVLLSLGISSRGYLLRNGRVIKEGSASALMESREVRVLCLGEETDKSP